MAGEARRTAQGTTDPRVMPQNLDLEQTVLGALLMHNSVYANVGQILNPECFFEEVHRTVYQYAAALLADGKAANPLTLRTYFSDPDLGGMTLGAYLAQLCANACPPGQVPEYAVMLADLAQRRRSISIAMSVLDAAYDMRPDVPTRAVVDMALDQFAEIRTGPGEVQGFIDFDTASHAALMAAQEAYKGGGKLVGHSTGLPSLDNAMGGLQAPDLIILAGRPGMGKTALATNIAYAVAKAADQARQAGNKMGGVGFFSLEMSHEQLAARIISEQSGVPSWKVRRGFASATDMDRYVEVQREINRLPLYIDPTGGISIGALCVRARQLKKRRGLSLVVIDYLQLITSGDKGRGEKNRVQELTEITGALKALAKELQVPVIALSQLSRRVEERDDKRPLLSDLRESGSIEQDADSVVFLYRDEYYLRGREKHLREGTDEHAVWLRQMHRAKGVAEAIIAKNRHGPATTVVLGFNGDMMRFLDEPEPRDEEPDLPERPRKEKPKVTGKAAITLYDVLRGMSISRSVAATPEHRKLDRALPGGARLIDVDEARRIFGETYQGPESADENKVRKTFSDAFGTLRAAGVAYYSRQGDTYFAWLPEQAGK